MVLFFTTYEAGAGSSWKGTYLFSFINGEFIEIFETLMISNLSLKVLGTVI